MNWDIVQQIIFVVGATVALAGLAYVVYRTATDKPSAYQLAQHAAYQERRMLESEMRWHHVGDFFTLVFYLGGFAIFLLVVTAIVIWAWRIVF